MAAHHEIHFEACIVDQLTDNGWLEGDHTHCDRQLALYPEDASNWAGGGSAS